ncbi:MAG: hypothetical protein VB859_16720, partial [Planctomycetaceae bacterium]
LWNVAYDHLGADSLITDDVRIDIEVAHSLNGRLDLNEDGLVDVLGVTAAIDSDGFGFLPTSNSMDLDHDGYDDLMIGAPQADSLRAQVLEDAGAIYAVYGSPRRLELPDEEEDGIKIHPFSNQAFTGAGEVLIDPATGRPEQFTFDLTGPDDIDGDGLKDPDGEITYDEVLTTVLLDDENYILTPEQSERWYEFTLAGDGQAGDMIRILPDAYTTQTLTLSGPSGFSLEQGNASDPWDLSFGDFSLSYLPVSSNAAVELEAALEFDLSNLIEGHERPEDIQQAELVLSAVPLVQAFSNPEQLTVVDGVLFFTAETNGTGRELWASGGTAGTTQLLGDIVAGPDSSSPQNLTAVGQHLFFAAPTEHAGEAFLWFSSSQRPEAQILSKDVTDPREFTAIDGQIYFVAETTNGDTQLFLASPDGDSFSVRQVSGFKAVDDEPAQITRLVSVGRTLFMATRDGAPASTTHSWLRAYDTDSGTFRKLKKLSDSFGDEDSADLLRNSHALGNTLLFSSTDASGTDLWTATATDIGPLQGSTIGTSLSAPTAFAEGEDGPNKEVYFLAFDQSSPTTTLDLWSTDGSESGTQKLYTIDYYLGDILDTKGFEGLYSDGKYFLRRHNGLSTGRLVTIESFDLTTMTLTSLRTISPDAGQRLGNLTLVDGTVVFELTENSGPRTHSQIWVTDGTDETDGRTEMVEELDVTGLTPPHVSQLTEFGEELIFAGPVLSSFFGTEASLYVHDMQDTIDPGFHNNGLLDSELLIHHGPISIDMELSYRTDGADHVISRIDMDATTAMPTEPESNDSSFQTPTSVEFQVDLTSTVQQLLTGGERAITLRLKDQSDLPTGFTAYVLVSSPNGEETGLQVTRRDG